MIHQNGEKYKKKKFFFINKMTKNCPNLLSNIPNKNYDTPFCPIIHSFGGRFANKQKKYYGNFRSFFSS
jgi:hypothetical protein